MSETQTIIIGGGLAGVTSFYELTARNVPCVLLERNTAIAQGASFANGAVLHPSLPDPWNNPGVGRHLFASLFNPHAPMRLSPSQLPQLFGWGFGFLRNAAPARHKAIAKANFALADYATRQTDALQQYLNLDIDYAAPGTLKLLRSQKEREAALQLADMLAAHGLVYQDLSPANVVAREPALADAAAELTGALYFPDDRLGDARRFCEQLAKAAIARGGQMRHGVSVTRLLKEDGKIVGVRLVNEGGEAEELRGAVVLCAGAAAPKLVAPLGLNLPIQPAKGYSLTFALDNESRSLAPHHPIVDPILHIGVTPLADRIRILGMAEFAGFDTKIAPTRVTMLQDFFAQVFPQLAAQIDWQKTDTWAGLRPMASDGRPFIGATPLDGLWLNCGHGHLGWTMAVGSAKLLADAINGQPAEIDAAPFAYDKERRQLG